MSRARIQKTDITPQGEMKKIKQAGRTSYSHQNFIRSLPCLACGRRPVLGYRNECAHIRLPLPAKHQKDRGGTQFKPADRWTVPLCQGCHEEQHEGEQTFWADLGIDPIDAASLLWTLSGKPDRQAKGEALIFKARQRMALNGGK